MTRPMRVLEDGTHWYACGHGYKPVAEEDRKYGHNKPDDPRAVRFYGTWFLPLDLLPEEDRVMPQTRPDDATLDHRALCRCLVCQRPQAAVLWRHAMRKGRIRPGSDPRSAQAQRRQ
jgi:hypothetical protein